MQTNVQSSLKREKKKSQKRKKLVCQSLELSALQKWLETQQTD